MWNPTFRKKREGWSVDIQIDELVSGSGVALDSSGNLYAGLSGNLGTTDSGGVRIYVPPFSGAPNVANGVFGTTLAVGK